MAIGLALGSSHAAASTAVAAGATGLTAGKVLAIGAAGTAAAAAGIYAGHKISQNPKALSASRLVMGAVLFSPLLAAEDIARKMGADIPKEGVFCNNEGKSIWQIWNESAAK
jgi:hypothetical protein